MLPVINSSAMTPNEAGVFCKHTFAQITGRLSVRAREQFIGGFYTEVTKTAAQYIFNVCGAAVYAGLPKESSYDKIAALMQAIANINQFAEVELGGVRVRVADHAQMTTHAETIVEELERLSAFFAELLTGFVFDIANIKK